MKHLTLAEIYAKEAIITMIIGYLVCLVAITLHFFG